MPAFNDFKYADNATLLEEIVAQYESNPDMGWADVLGGTSPLQPWPKGNRGLVNIQYCWLDLETKSKLENAIQGGWEMWHTRLGNGGPGSGHRIGGFSEYKHNGNMVFCWLDDEDEDWNPKVSSGNLVIMIDPNKDFGGYATIGYNPEEWVSRPHRNQMRLGWAGWHMRVPGLQHWLAAHEIGHVLGLAHEHQRIDRWHYVHFDCKNLAGYAEAAKLIPSHPTTTMDKLCRSSIYSQMEPWKSLGFAPHDYLTEEYYDMWHKDKHGRLDGTDHRFTVTPGSHYDYNSIMHYPSMMNIAKGRDQRKVQDLPLVAWRQASVVPPSDATSEKAKPVYMNIEPTKEDCEGVINWYPW